MKATKPSDGRQECRLAARLEFLELPLVLVDNLMGLGGGLIASRLPQAAAADIDGQRAVHTTRPRVPVVVGYTNAEMESRTPGGGLRSAG